MMPNRWRLRAVALMTDETVYDRPLSSELVLLSVAVMKKQGDQVIYESDDAES